MEANEQTVWLFHKVYYSRLNGYYRNVISEWKSAGVYLMCLWLHVSKLDWLVFLLQSEQFVNWNKQPQAGTDADSALFNPPTHPIYKSPQFVGTLTSKHQFVRSSNTSLYLKRRPWVTAAWRSGAATSASPRMSELLTVVSHRSLTHQRSGRRGQWWSNFYTMTVTAM